MLCFWLFPIYRIRPVVVEIFSRLPFSGHALRLVNAVPMPDFDSAINQFKIKKSEETLNRLASDLKNGDNFLLYPSGRLKAQGKEMIPGTSAVHTLLQKDPHIGIVLVRISGFWGSSFSKALTGKSPPLIPSLLNGLKTILSNLIFFTPRRDIYVELERAPADFPRNGTRLEINQYLEKWYNQYRDDAGSISESEPLKLIPLHFWSRKIPQAFADQKKELPSPPNPVPPQIQSKIQKELRRILKNPSLQITPEKKLGTDLGMDSLNMAELAVFLSRQFPTGEIHPQDLDTVQDVWELASRTDSQSARDKESPPFKKTEEPSRPNPTFPNGRTFQEAFLNSCDHMGSSVAMSDDLVGEVSYKKFKQSVLILAEHFRKYPENHVAVMLPASVGVFIIILALHFAGKTPLMLNWTLGPYYLEQMMEIGKATRVLTSWRFIDQLSYVDFGKLVGQIEFLEDIRKELPLSTKLKGLFLSYLSPQILLKKLKLDAVDENDPAVILFTSGTTSHPKGVPLSHKNILSNIESVFKVLGKEVDHSSTVYEILPPFHSFGFTAGGFVSLLTGIRVACFPDPTDNFGIANGIERWKPTHLPIVPSFLKRLFEIAEKSQLKSLKQLVVAAEKASHQLYQTAESFGISLLEGYGITECSPVLSIRRPDKPIGGVGQLLPGIECVTIHPETLELLPEGEEGELCVCGPNVFSGYLGDLPSPFIEIDGKSWYRTGDIGHLDKDQTVFLSDRLKRFTKLGGEMISLAAIENALIEGLQRRGHEQQDAPSLVVCADEKIADSPELIIFTTLPFDQETANHILQEAGFGRLIKVSGVRAIDEIPLMGSGKTNYRALQELLQKQDLKKN
jgi:long-chain-fatty-acid--[acyl-carrier-protein] ligase